MLSCCCTKMSSTFKVVLLGEGRVGKTSLMIRYVEGSYSDRRQSTLNASYLDKHITIPSQNSTASNNNSNTEVDLSIWDTAGQERFHSLGPIYYRDADGAVVVYDITDAKSFTKVKTWTKELRKMVGGEDSISIVVVGNKIDLENQRQVDEEEVAKYVESVGARHFHASAKLGTGVDDIFLNLSQRMIDQRKSKPKRTGLAERIEAGSGNKQKLILLTSDKESPIEPKSSCC